VRAEAVPVVGDHLADAQDGHGWFPTKRIATEPVHVLGDDVVPGNDRARSIAPRCARIPVVGRQHVGDAGQQHLAVGGREVAEGAVEEGDQTWSGPLDGRQIMVDVARVATPSGAVPCGEEQIGRRAGSGSEFQQPARGDGSEQVIGVAGCVG